MRGMPVSSLGRCKWPHVSMGLGLILVVALLVFGPKKLPELARMLGRGMGEFRRASNDLRQSLALDDLQNDLRKDLESAQSLMKPDLKSMLKPDDPGDRPPQAGDTLDPQPTQQTPPSHPGELPLGNDHDHHPETPEGSEASTPATSESSAFEYARRAATTSD